MGHTANTIVAGGDGVTSSISDGTDTYGTTTTTTNMGISVRGRGMDMGIAVVFRVTLFVFVLLFYCSFSVTDVVFVGL